MDITKTIDHTLLAADATEAQILELCAEAQRWSFATVCIAPFWVRCAHQQLADTAIGICTAVGFPLGNTLSSVKAYEAEKAIRHGADEIDMVMAIGQTKQGNWQSVKDDIAAVIAAADGRCVKVILEICLLTDEEIVRSCQVAEAAGARFVKTSTGFSSHGATVGHVKLMHDNVSDKVAVKASGGIRSLSEATALIDAGATRLGTSSGVAIAQAAAAPTE